MSRTNARKNAFCLLFQRSFVEQEDMDSAKAIFFEENPDIDDSDKAFIIKNVDGVLENIEEIDSIINSAAKGWTTERMAKVDLAILRLAVYEMKYTVDTPKSVAINEAVELAKKFSSDEAPAFINGILGNLL